MYLVHPPSHRCGNLPNPSICVELEGHTFLFVSKTSGEGTIGGRWWQETLPVAFRVTEGLVAGSEGWWRQEKPIRLHFERRRGGWQWLLANLFCLHMKPVINGISITKQKEEKCVHTFVLCAPYARPLIVVGVGTGWQLLLLLLASASAFGVGSCRCKLDSR